MATEFLAVAADPQRLFSQIQAWANQTGVSLVGDASGGTFSGRPGFPASLVYPIISGRYSVHGTQISIHTDQSLPPNEVQKRLARVGLSLVSSS